MVTPQSLVRQSVVNKTGVQHGKQIKEGKIKGTRRRERRRKQLLDDLKEARRYRKLKKEAQGRTI
jgi:hypothetical protein